MPIKVDWNFYLSLILVVLSSFYFVCLDFASKGIGGILRKGINRLKLGTIFLGLAFLSVLLSRLTNMPFGEEMSYFLFNLLIGAGLLSYIFSGLEFINFKK